MRLISLLTFFVAFLAPLAAATQMIKSTALNLCMASSNFSANYFSVAWYPGNSTIQLTLDGTSAIQGHVLAQLTLTAYGYQAYQSVINPCAYKSQGVNMCPMAPGPIPINSMNINVPKSTASKIPSIAYTIPDLDAKVRIVITLQSTGQRIACVEAMLSNGKTVYQEAVAWVTAIISGLGLAASAITSGMGHSNTAAHVAANALSLFGFYQGQAMLGMTSVHMPPIVESWTQNFQWSMGIIHVDFLETLCTWYQRSTGGTASTLLSQLSYTSVQVLKRRKRDLVDPAMDLVKRTASSLTKSSTANSGQSLVVLTGIRRVGFVSGIEVTNIFLTGLIFFVVFVLLVIIVVASFKGICELLVKNGQMSPDKFQDFRNGWKLVLRGILFRLCLIGFPQMCVLCMWEFTEVDSPAEVVLAAVMFLSMVVALGWASQKVIRLAKRSVTMHKNPAYILYSDPSCLNKWGFLYVQYRATAYYFVVPVLTYILVKGMFIGLAQSAYIVQVVAFLVLEGAMLVGVCVLRPWMDKKTNVFNISISVVNFLNAVFLLFFADVFGQPGIVTGVMGIVFFVYNAAFALVLLVLVLIAAVYAVVSKNPDTRYQPMRDDRGSFIKSQTNLTTELDALGATARGEPKSNPFDEEEITSFSSANGAPGLHHNTPAAHQAPPSPVDPSVPLFPSNTAHRPPPGGGYDQFRTPSPAARGYDNAPVGVSAMTTTYRAQNNASPWQRGAGYDH